MAPTPQWYWMDMGGVGRKTVEQFFSINPGENVVVTADTMSEWRVVEETVQASYTVGVVPTLVVHPTPLEGKGRLAHVMVEYLESKR